MQKRYFVAAGILACVAWAWASPALQVRPAVDFSKAALPPPTQIDVRAVASTTHVSLPVELGPLTKRIEQNLPETLAVVHDYLPDAACAKRTTTLECANAKLEGLIKRNGPVELIVAQTLITFVVPVNYALKANGNAWAANLTEQKTGEAKINVAFAISVNPAGGLDVVRQPQQTSDEAPIALLKGNVRLSHLLDATLKPVIHDAEDDLRRALAVLPIKTAIAHAWDALAQPLELGHGSGAWLRGAPDFYAAGAFASSNGALSYEIPVTTHLAILDADKLPSNNAKRVAMQSQDLPPVGPSRVRMAVPVDLEAMRQQANSVFAGKTFESRADRFSEPVKVKVVTTRLYPALHQIGLELDVDVTGAKGVKQSGKLHLAGRPILDQATGTVTLADVTFPPQTGKEALGQLPGVPRIGTEPFASAFTAAAKLDISRALTDALPRGRQLLDQQIGKDLQLQGRLVEAVPVSLELARDGAWLIVDLMGEVAFVYNGAMDEIPTLQPIAAVDQKSTPITAPAKSALTPVVAKAPTVNHTATTKPRTADHRHVEAAPKKHASTKVAAATPRARSKQSASAPQVNKTAAMLGFM